MAKDPKKVTQGKKNKASGAEFERRVRADLEESGWIVDKWNNNVELTKTIKLPEDKKVVFGRLIHAKNKWAGPGRPMMMGAGFPDFIAFKLEEIFNRGGQSQQKVYEVIGVESKINGYLTQVEKEKCKWLLDNNIFSKILIAEKTKVKNRIVIVYHDFEEKYED